MASLWHVRIASLTLFRSECSYMKAGLLEHDAAAPQPPVRCSQLQQETHRGLVPCAQRGDSSLGRDGRDFILRLRKARSLNLGIISGIFHLILLHRGGLRVTGERNHGGRADHAV